MEQQSHFDRACFARAARAELEELAELAAGVVCDAQDQLDAIARVHPAEVHPAWLAAERRRDRGCALLCDVVDPLVAAGRPLGRRDLHRLRRARRRFELELREGS